MKMHNDFERNSIALGRTLSEMTREMIAAFIRGDLRIKRDMSEYNRQIELGRNLYVD